MVSCLSLGDVGQAAGDGGLKGGAVCITGDIDAMSAWELMR